MARKRIAVLVASIDREYQQDFASGLVSAGVQNDVDICIFNSQGHMNVAISTNSEVGESMIYDLPDLDEFDGVISMLATMGNDVAYHKCWKCSLRCAKAASRTYPLTFRRKVLPASCSTMKSASAN